MSDVAFRAATPDDVAILHPLIERAYRGETAKAGWTHEADLLFDDRTSADELSALIADPERAILLAFRDDALVGCVQVARAGAVRQPAGLVPHGVPLVLLEGNLGARRAYLEFGFEGYQLDPAMGQALFMEKKLG